jgi:tRNA-Thr(GGU) m(6)t(6)A37 methyltransferase TsaA
MDINDMQPNSSLPISLIAHVKSPFLQKVGVPRQAGLVPSALQEIVFAPQFQNPNFCRGLETFSHIWVLFWFHDQLWNPNSACAHPPRLGGRKQVGVFACRTPHRPTPIGMSCCELVEVKSDRLIVSGGDFLDGTPVVDIKPYVPYCDAKSEASEGWLAELPVIPAISISWEEVALKQLQHLSVNPERDKRIISETIALDPRTSPERNHISSHIWKLYLLAYDIHWAVPEQGHAKICQVLAHLR